MANSALGENWMVSKDMNLNYCTMHNHIILTISCFLIRKTHWPMWLNMLVFSATSFASHLLDVSGGTSAGSSLESTASPIFSQTSALTYLACCQETSFSMNVFTLYSVSPQAKHLKQHHPTCNNHLKKSDSLLVDLKSRQCHAAHREFLNCHESEESIVQRWQSTQVRDPPFEIRDRCYQQF